MRRALVAASVLFALCTGAAAQEPAKPTIDQNIDRVAALDKQIADLTKQRAALVSDLQADFKRLSDKIDKLVGPAPAPQPPVPPKPEPPADPLREKLKAAYGSDPAAPGARRAQALDLAALYRAAADLARDEAVGTSGELLAKVADAAGRLLRDPPGGRHLAAVRRAASGELAALLPTDAPLTAAQRKAAADLFARLATLIEDIAK